MTLEYQAKICWLLLLEVVGIPDDLGLTLVNYLHTYRLYLTYGAIS